MCVEERPKLAWLVVCCVRLWKAWIEIAIIMIMTMTIIIIIIIIVFYVNNNRMKLYLNFKMYTKFTVNNDNNLK